MSNTIKYSLDEAFFVMQKFVSNPTTIESIEKTAELIANSLRKGGKVITCGNGGSLCDATHFAEELTGRFRNNRISLPAISINDSAHITCVANDYSYNEIYSKYIEAIGNKDDVFIGFSTSGNSENIIQGASKAKEKGMTVVGMIRSGESKLFNIADIVIAVEHSGFSDRIQEMHILAVHIIIESIEEKLGLNN